MLNLAKLILFWVSLRHHYLIGIVFDLYLRQIENAFNRRIQRNQDDCTYVI